MSVSTCPTRLLVLDFGATITDASLVFADAIDKLIVELNDALNGLITELSDDVDDFSDELNVTLSGLKLDGLHVPALSGML